MDIEDYRRRVGRSNFNAHSEQCEQRELYDHGYRAGEAAGRLEMERQVDRAIGIGVVMGFGMGIVVAWATLGWLTP